MGNRAIITDKERYLGLYLHWNGGLGSVEAFLRYCALKGYRDTEADPAYAYARLAQVVGNYFGGTLSVGIMPYTDDEHMDPGDNGIYVIEHWGIVGRYSSNGLTEERLPHDMDKMLHRIDASMPEEERLGAFLDADEVPVSDVGKGERVYVYGYHRDKGDFADGFEGWKAYEVAGFGEGVVANLGDVTGRPFVARFGRSLSEQRSNCNNYLKGPTVRILR